MACATWDTKVFAPGDMVDVPKVMPGDGGWAGIVRGFERYTRLDMKLAQSP